VRIQKVSGETKAANAMATGIGPSARVFIWDTFLDGRFTPREIKVANELFSPTQQQVERARKLIAGYAKAEQEGLGAVAIDGVMVDAASARLMRNTTAKADLIGM
jgi:malate synthase